MGIFELFSKKIFGICGKVSEEPEIVDGILLSEDEKPIEAEVESEEVQDILSMYEETMMEIGKESRTIKEYIYAIKCFGNPEELDLLSKERIEELLNSMNPATARMRMAALNSFAKWRVRNGEHTLYVTLAMVNY